MQEPTKEQEGITAQKWRELACPVELPWVYAVRGCELLRQPGSLGLKIDHETSSKQNGHLFGGLHELLLMSCVMFSCPFFCMWYSE